MEISDGRNKKVLFSQNGCWVCGIHTAGQLWRRQPSDQPLVSPYSASLFINQTSDENYGNHQPWKILSWCTNKFSELWCQERWGTVKENEQFERLHWNGEGYLGVCLNRYCSPLQGLKKKNCSSRKKVWLLNSFLIWEKLCLNFPLIHSYTCQYMRLQDLFCLWPLQLIANRIWIWDDFM